MTERLTDKALEKAVENPQAIFEKDLNVFMESVEIEPTEHEKAEKILVKWFDSISVEDVIEDRSVIEKNTPKLPIDDIRSLSTHNTEAAENNEDDNSSEKTTSDVNESKRPTPIESEEKAKEIYGGKEQQSYKDGKKVPYGTPGSTRPDLVVIDEKTGKITAIEVKNYDLRREENVDRLCDELKRQVEDRKQNMPEGTEQMIVLDVRGQDLTQEKIDTVCDKIKDELKDIYPDIKIEIIKEGD